MTDSTFNDYLALHIRCMRSLGPFHCDTIVMENAIQYWGQQDGMPPPLVGNDIEKCVAQVKADILERGVDITAD